MSSPFTAAAHVSPALFLLVPLFALALIPRALSHKYPTSPHAHRAYAFIALLAFLSTLAGALPLAHATPPVAIAVVQALLSFFLAIPALHLASTPQYAPHNINSVLQIAHTSILVISLLGATLTALVLPNSSASSPLYLPPALFLLYSLLALLRVSSTLFCFLRPLLSRRSVRSSNSSSSSCFFNRSSTARRPITIHIETQRTSIPLSLSSPASSSATSLHFSPDTPRHSQHNHNQREERPIELELALPKRKDSRSRLNNTDGRYLYQDEKKSDNTALIEKRPHPHHHHHHHHQERKSKHEKSKSIDSTASSASTVTITATDHTERRRRSLSPPPIPLPLEGLTTPPRAIHHHHNNNNTSALNSSGNFDQAPFSSAHQEEHILYPFPDQASTHEEASVVVIDGSSATIRAGGGIDHFNSICFGEDVVYSRSRTLLILLFAAQLTLVVGYACAVGGSVDSSSSSSHLISTLVSLKIIQSITTVLAITGTMSAYLLHAYNTHLSPSRSRRSQATEVAAAQPPPPPPSAYKPRHHTHTPSTPFGYGNPTSAKSASALFSPNGNGNVNGYHHHHHQQQYHPQRHHHQHYNHDGNTPVLMHHQNHIQVAETNVNKRPVIIQLAPPPPPPRTRRKRVDAAAFGSTQAISVEDGMRGGGGNGAVPMDVPRSVSNRSNPSSSEDNGEIGGPHGFSYAASSYPHSNSHSLSERVYHHQRQHHQYQQISGHNNHNDNDEDAYDGSGYAQYRSNNESNLYYYDQNVNNANNNLYGRAQPITLTYEPPLISGGMSLLEATETEGEGEGEDEEEEDEDLDFEDVMDDDMRNMGMNVDDMDTGSELDLEGEMEKALSLSLSLSRSSSMASTMSGSGSGSGVCGDADVKRRGSKSKSQPEPKPKPKPKTKIKTKTKAKKPVEDPATYIRKRGSMPATPRSRKLFGWEFGRDSAVPLPLPAAVVNLNLGRRGSVSAGAAKRSKGSVKENLEREKEARENLEAQESSFMDLKGGAIGKEPSGGGATGPTRKLKRHSTPAGSLYRSLVGGGNEAKEREREKQEKWDEIFAGRDVDPSGGGEFTVVSAAQASIINMNLESKKLRKMRSESASLRPIAPAAGAPASRGFVTTSSSSGGSTLNGNSGAKSGSSTSRPGTGDSSKAGHGSRVSLNNGRGLQLKRSFKLSVGRTLGPGLTLASASIGTGKEEVGEKMGNDNGDDAYSERRPSDDRPLSMGFEEDVDVDGEIRSITAARLVSASIARVTPAATIVTAPLANASIPAPPPSSKSISNSGKAHPSPANFPTLSSAVPQRPVLHAIVTSAPVPIPTANAIPFPMSAPASRRPPTGLSPAALSPASGNQPPHTSGSNWKPHPFADLMDPSPATMMSSYTTASSEGVVTVEDDVVLLEREMVGIRGRRGDGNNLMESPTIQFRELEAAMGVQGVSVSASPPTPLLSSSMTPSVNNMFAVAHAQAQTVGPPPPPTPTLAAAAVTAATNTSTTTAGGTSEKTKNKIFGGSGQTQKRIALSSPPASKTDWGPQSSGGGAGGGFPYRFPMIFPHSVTGSPPRPGVQANGQGVATPRPATPRGGGTTLRLSAMTMSTVRNTFAGIGARMSSATSRMSVNSTVGGFKAGNGHAFGEMVMEDAYGYGDGDFMDLRDPFASPPPTSTVAIVPAPPVMTTQKKTSRNKVGVLQGDDVLDRMDPAYDLGMKQVPDATRKKMSAWGKLPMPARSFSPAPSAGSGNASTGSKRHSFIISGRIVGKPSSAAHRKHKKERRTRKATLPSMAGAMASSKAGAEDSDFGLEEALLSQRLLNRLVSDGWENRV